tara:strand:+ start:41 stop:382 length:342 start_codon:yes stop_codon:yes gene_type:complete
MAGTLDSLFGGGLKSYQTGAVASGTSTGSGEDLRYVDVTVSSVDVLKTACSFDGGFALGTSTEIPLQKYGGSSSVVVKTCTIRMLNATTVRISTRDNAGTARIVGRWQMAESK